MNEKFVDEEVFNETVQYLQEQNDQLKREVNKLKRRINNAN